jgi:hypothetical protein
MVKRKKRLEKGIKSLNSQIILHKDKMQNALEKGKIELARYYEIEIEKFRKVKEKKKSYLDK